MTGITLLLDQIAAPHDSRALEESQWQRAGGETRAGKIDADSVKIRRPVLPDSFCRS